MEWPLPLKFSQNKLAFVSNIPSLPPPPTSVSDMSLLESIAQSFFIFKLLFSLITNQ